MKTEAMLAAALLTLAGPVAAEGVDEDTCFRINQAVVDMEMAMLGMGELPAARQKLAALRDQAPSMTEQLDGMLEVARKAENSKPMDPSHPIQTGEHEKAEAEYRKIFRKECGEL